MKVQNIVNGEVITDPKELESKLGLTMNDNCMINSDYSFPPDAKGDHLGYQLPMVMLAVKLGRVDQFVLVDFIQRLGYLDACGSSPIPLPNGVDDLVRLYGKLKGWIDKGWEIETDLVHMDRPDYVDFTEFKVTKDVIGGVRELRSTLRAKLAEELPPQAAKDLLT